MSTSAELVLSILVQILNYYGRVILSTILTFLGKQNQDTYFQVCMVTGHLSIQNGFL